MSSNQALPKVALLIMSMVALAFGIGNLKKSSKKMVHVRIKRAKDDKLYEVEKCKSMRIHVQEEKHA